MGIQFVEDPAQATLRKEVAALAHECFANSRSLVAHREVGTLAVWTRCDLHALTTRGTHKGGPDWDSVVCRITLDANTGTVLARDVGSSLKGAKRAPPDM